MQYRYSALDTFGQCPTRYRMQYVEGLQPPIDLLWLVGGTAFHKAMEEFYKNGTDKLKAGRAAWAEWLESKGVDKPWNVVRDFHELWVVRRGLLEPFRSGEIIDPKTNQPYKKPTATNAFKAIKAKSGYDGLKRHADSHVVPNLYLREQDNLADSFADCMDWLSDYEQPEEYGKLLHSEHKFFITDPWGNTHEGSIDCVFEYLPEPGEYAIHDFKTSKTPKKIVDLDPQLNMYAYAGKQLFGKYPRQVSLHFVRYGLVVKAEVQESTVEKVYEEWVKPRVLAAQLATEHAVWLKHSPEGFGSPCGMCQYFISGMCNKEYKEATNELQGEGGSRQDEFGAW